MDSVVPHESIQLALDNRVGEVIVDEVGVAGCGTDCRWVDDTVVVVVVVVIVIVSVEIWLAVG
jgi:hypothetical protein